ncbi:histamine N-methyltransferase-like [Protopterus annectens]|uniref:histamine N-methyltransferase-like n=1 Tax=Protopterus annectens TaxID=7888 RepID=UPI001CF9E753|nr:histamine N-methyltransferase-like [Protopterus annectens]
MGLYSYDPGNSGWASIDKKYGTCLPLHNDTCAVISSHFIKDIIQKMGMKCQHYDLPSVIDITTCFNDGSEEGTLLLDFVTHTLNFSKSAPPSLKVEIMKYLRGPECSTVKDEKIMFNNNLGAVVIEP